MIPFPYTNYNVVLDTNILSDFCSGDQNIKNQMLKLLLDLSNNHNSLFYSNFTLLEILHNLNQEKEKLLLEKLAPFYRYLVNEHILQKAAKLSALYKKEGLNIEDADVIIATTAINDGITMHFLVTSNGKDFPKPFFREYHREYLYHGINQKNHGRVKPIHYLFPDIAVINAGLVSKEMSVWQEPNLIPNTPIAQVTQLGV